MSIVLFAIKRPVAANFGRSIVMLVIAHTIKRDNKGHENKRNSKRENKLYLTRVNIPRPVGQIIQQYCSDITQIQSRHCVVQLERSILIQI